jgi:hypothetical protein
MLHAKVRFGFLTTYKETIFLKQEPEKNPGEFVLRYSQVIQHDSDWRACLSAKVIDQLGFLFDIHKTEAEKRRRTIPILVL